MAVENINSINNKELYAQYNWFSQSYPPIIQAVCDDFFLPGFKLTLVGISKNVNSLSDKDAYFVTKVRIDKQHDMFFRLSEKAVDIILERALGKANSRFNLNKLTDLEAKIITAFNDSMYNGICELFAPAPPTLKRTNFDVIFLTFLLRDVDTNAAAKLIISLPEVLLAPETVQPQGNKFNYTDFSDSTVDVSIKVGNTRTKLIDIKNIDVDDIVVLDNSDTNHMVLRFRDYEQTINLNPNLGLVLPFDNEEGDEDMADNNTNLWDSIEVEMNAEFDSVKITLGELKNVEEGMVVDLTSIYDNKVTLSVENKPIARGELVIVNDRYGVKIEEVIALKPQQEASPLPEQIVADDNVDTTPDDMEMNQPEQEDMPQQAQEEDEFDYSDFELEDEDI